MKNSIVGTILIGVLLSSSAFAYIAGKELKADTPIYCPQTIECKSTTPPSRMLCTVVDSDPQYWTPLQAFDFDTGTYHLYQVISGYEMGRDSSPFQAKCLYFWEKDKRYGGFMYAKLEHNLEAYNNAESKWTIYHRKDKRDKKDQDKAICGAYASPVSQTKSCPLVTRRSLLIHNTVENAHVYIYGHTPVTYYVAPHYSEVRFDDVIPFCSSAKICSIDIASDSRGEVAIGTVSVDMDDEMRVIEVTSNNPSIGIGKIGFNSVEIKYTGNK